MIEENDEIRLRQPNTNLRLLERDDIFIDTVDSTSKTETIHMDRIEREQAIIDAIYPMSSKNYISMLFCKKDIKGILL